MFVDENSIQGRGNYTEIKMQQTIKQLRSSIHTFGRVDGGDLELNEDNQIRQDAAHHLEVEKSF